MWTPISDFLETSLAVRFVRQSSAFRGRITADGSGGFRAERSRYRIDVSLARPWARRALIVRRLKRVEQAVSVSAVDPVRDERGWAFRSGAGHGHDPANGFAYLSEAKAGLSGLEYAAPWPEHRPAAAEE